MPKEQADAIRDPIARDTWSYLGKDGLRHTVEIVVGRPIEMTAGEIPVWACPLFVEGMTQGVKNMKGVGPVDALLNAATIVKSQKVKHVRPGMGGGN